MPLADSAYQDLKKLRNTKPLILNMTNYVVANTNANALLALGASPAMTHNPTDVEELMAFAQSFVLNIGTPTEEFLEAMHIAGKTAKRLQTPIVLDPVAAGATSVRSKAALSFIQNYSPRVIRGNASEILALAGAGGAPHGVDSSQSSNSALEGATELAKLYHCTVCISGETDYITDGQKKLAVLGGSSLMPLVTGLGCTATALIGAFLAVNPDAMQATAHAMAIMAVCGEIAAESAKGPGTLQLYFYDALYALDHKTLSKCQVKTV